MSALGLRPMLSEPRPEYNGMVLGQTFGNFAFAIACRVLGLRDLGPALSPFNAFMVLTGILLFTGALQQLNAYFNFSSSGVGASF